jgi:predicted metal-dependent enzyme (double-stranded beta helix superfamily)
MEDIHDHLYELQDYSIESCIEVLNLNKKRWIDSMTTNQLQPISIEQQSTYQRRILFRNNEYEIIHIVWEPSGSSPIHDHADRGCCMLVCSGELVEKRYGIDGDGGVSIVQSRRICVGDRATFINNANHVHKIINPSPEIQAQSIHIYSPPRYVARIYSETDSNE